MIDAPSIYDEQLAMMIKQVQGASMYLYKLSNEDRKIATDQYCKPQRIFLILLSLCEAASEFDRGSPSQEKKERRKREQRFYGVRWAQAE